MSIKKYVSKGIAIVAIFALTVTPCFASSNNDSDLYNINSLEELKFELSNIDVQNLSQKEILIRETDPKIASKFVDEKMQLLAEKVETIEIVGEGKKVIDLGDNCTATIYTTDEPEGMIGNIPNNGISLLSNTPGATTLWKEYGSRKFTSKFEVRTGILDVDLKLINHYTLSSKGVALRYGESDVVKVKGNVDLGSASAGSVNEVKKTAYTKGEKIHISSTFSYRWAPAYDVAVISKKFKMHSYVKFSDIDKTAKEVKVVQSWNGTYL